jgi:GTP cyclohydrolase I
MSYPIHLSDLAEPPRPASVSLSRLQQEYDELEARYETLVAKAKEKNITIDGLDLEAGYLRDWAEDLLTFSAGLDVQSGHGRETPQRFIFMLDELTSCKHCTGDCMKWKVFPSPIDQMVVINRIPFSSVCNHHVVPFVGHAWIGYVPNGNIGGLSKFARVVHHYARRLQVQEELTDQIAEFLETTLKPLGVIVVLEAEHLCMTIRGVQTPGTTTRTVETRGVFADHTKTAKNEFLMGIK